MNIRNPSQPTYIRDHTDYKTALKLIGIITFITILFSLGNIYKTKLEFERNLARYTKTLDKALEEKILFYTEFLTTLGNKITHDTVSGNELTISNLIKEYDLSRISDNTTDTISMRNVNWHEAQTNLSINKNGVIKDQIAYNAKNDHFLSANPYMPYLYKISEINSALNSVYVGMSIGITNKNNIYQGYMNAVLDLSNLSHLINSASNINKDFVFVLLDTNKENLLLQKIDADGDIFANLKYEHLGNSKIGKLDLTHKEYSFSHYIRLLNNTYLLLLGHKKNLLINHIIKGTLPKSLIIFITGNIFLVVFMFFRRKDTQNFNSALLHYDDEKNSREDFIKFTNKSCYEKDKFVEEVYDCIHKDLSYLSEGMRLIINNLHGNNKIILTQERRMALITDMYNKIINLTELKVLTGKKEQTNVYLLIEEIIDIHRPTAITNNVKLVNNTSNNIPEIHIDKIFLKQIIVSITASLLFNMPEEGTIKIEATLSKHNTLGESISIVVQDDGYGAWKDIDQTTSTLKSILLGWDKIEHAVNDRNGIACLEDSKYHGTIVAILLPLNNKAETTPKTKDSNKKSNNVIRLFKENA